MSIKDRILHYLYGVFAQGLNGAISALAAAAGLDTGAMFVADIPKMNFHMALACFGGAFVWNCIYYFKSNPLPAELPEGGQLKAALATVIPSTPTSPKALLIFGSLILLGLTGCQTASVASLKATLLDPNIEARAAKVLVGGVANRVLAKNPSYADDFYSMANALTALAQSNPGILSGSDVQAIAAKTNLDPSMQGELVADFNFLQGELLSEFPITLPSFKPIYQLWLLSIANGLYIATGHPAQPVPVIDPVSVPGTASAAP